MLQSKDINSVSLFVLSGKLNDIFNPPKQVIFFLYKVGLMIDIDAFQLSSGLKDREIEDNLFCVFN